MDTGPKSNLRIKQGRPFGVKGRIGEPKPLKHMRAYSLRVHVPL